MDAEGEPQSDGDRTKFHSFFRQQDEETPTSPMSHSHSEASLMEKERRFREEMQQFETLEKEFGSHPDNPRLLPRTHTVIIEREAYFRMIESGNRVTKHFYQNEFSSEKREHPRSYQTIAIETNNEPDYIEEEYTITFQEGDFPYPTKEEAYPKNIEQPDPISFSPPGKSILKKSAKEQPISTYSHDTFNPPQSTRSPSAEKGIIWYPFPDPPEPSSSRPEYLPRASPRDSIQQRKDPAPRLEEKKIFFPSPLPEIVDAPPQNKERAEAIQSHDHFLDKRRENDLQLPSLSRSRTNGGSQQKSTAGDNRTSKSKEFISPLFLQSCLLFLIVLNLLVAYFFNDIHMLWSWFFSPSSVSNHQKDEEKFSYW